MNKNAALGHNNPPSDMEELHKLAREQVRLEDKVEDLEEELKQTKAKLRNISENLLPEKMEELELPMFGMPNGEKVEIKDEIKASVSIERRPAANLWLREHGYGGLIKSNVVVPFGRDELEEADKLLNELKARNRIAELQETVHHQTMQSFVKEQLSEGKDIPLDTFGVTRGLIAKIKRPKVKE